MIECQPNKVYLCIFYLFALEPTKDPYLLYFDTKLTIRCAKALGYHPIIPYNGACQTTKTPRESKEKDV